MVIQIYEIKNPEEAKSVVDLGADQIGCQVGLGQFPGEISYDRANSIFSAVNHRAVTSAVTLSHNLDTIKDLIRSVRFDILHLGAHPDKIFPQHIFALKSEFPSLKIMQVVPVIDMYSLEIAKRYDGVVSFILLDSFRFSDSKLGATGETHDWSISQKIISAVHTPVILAGGLGPENVVSAINTVHPAGVDTKTRTDKEDGSGKDLVKVKAFIEAVRSVSPDK